jgi:ATP-dependent DNA helicase PIF1
LGFSWTFPRGRAEYVTPKLRNVPYAEYIRHLMLYKDMRFAQHPRFCYVVFNTLMRLQINTWAGFFVNNLHPEQKTLTVDQLRDAFNDDSDESRKIINSITRYSASLLGTCPYWSGQSKVFESMVRQLDCPNLLVMISAADMNWDSLMKLFPSYEEWLFASREERIRMACKNIRDSPHIVSYHFYRRLQAFQDHVFVPKFNVKDYCHRFEWQARGSTHDHGLWWSESTPDVNNIAISQEARDNFAKFWGIHITAFNPEPHSGARPAAKDSMIQTPGLELMNNGITLSSGLNQV